VSYIEEDQVTSAVIALLKAALPSTVKVYDHRAPAARTFPYVVVMRIPGGGSSGPPLHDPDVDLILAYQVDAVGNRRDSAEWVAGRAGRALVGRVDGAYERELPLPAEVRECGRMRLDTLGGVELEGLPPNEVFTVPNRYEIAVTPA
jgi:hypothetical protein